MSENLQRINPRFFLVMILGSTFPAAAAQSTTITNLVYPTRTVSAETAEVTFDFAYSGITGTDVLVAFIYDTVGNNIANGIASSSPEQCISLAGTRFSGDAACVWRPNSSSGTDHLTFNLQFSGTHIQTYDFSAAAGAISYTSLQSATALSFTQQPFTITAGTTVELTVSTTYPVAVSVDDSLMASGGIETTPGIHTVSVPTVVQIDNVSRLKFEHWDDGTMQSNRTLNVQTDTTVDAIYARQYLLTLISPPANVTGAGWYDDGASAQYSAPPAEPMPNFLGLIGGKLIFTGWYENGRLVTTANTAAITMLDAHTLTAQWRTDYQSPIITLGLISIAITGSVIFLIGRRSRKKTRP